MQSRSPSSVSPHAVDESFGEGLSSRTLTRSTGRFTRQTEGSQSLERGLELLRVFESGNSALTNAELAEFSGLPRPTVSRLTRSLVDAGFLQYDIDERVYRLGAVVVGLCKSFYQAATVIEIANPLMRRIARAEKISVALAVADRADILYLASARHSHVTGESIEIVPGLREPIEECPIGKAWLAAVPSAVRTAVLDRIAAIRPTPLTSSRAELDHTIAQVQANGFCVSTSKPGSLIHIASAFLGVDRQWYGLSITFLHIPGQRKSDVRRNEIILRTIIDKLQTVM